MIESVLLVGASGMLGGRIAHHLVRQAGAQVRLLVRSAQDVSRRPKLEPLMAAGAEIVEGDLADAGSLHRATAGIDVIVSAVQGGPDIIIDGQLALARAGKENGVGRILPSDFALDLFNATPGEHAAFDARRAADEGIGGLGLEQINVLQGGFMELFMPGMGAIDLDKGTVSFFGDGDRPIEVSSVDDTARVVARVALDRDVPAGKFAFAGDRISFRRAGEIVAARTGRALRPVSLGSEAELRAAMEVSDPQRKLMLAYLLYMTNGQAALTNLQNDRYSDLKLESFPKYAERRLAAPIGG